ncbi:anion permease [Kitasatospora sp. NBC_00315]|uniref:inorganic phosphate transporter n=1 Tax=Kitasatospora sp. NBC_00315 TaxID=2975963 RepID=UPI003255C525
MSHVTFLLVVVIVTALVFDFTNGFHDTANAMATSIATGALPPRVAVLLSAVLNVVGAFLSTAVAKTISGGIVNDGLITLGMIFAGLVGAILWNLLTWLLGLPSSSSHALIGGLVGAVCVGAGLKAVNFEEVLERIVIPGFAAPVVAGTAALLATLLVYRLSGRAAEESVTRGFRFGQIGSASLVSLAHGTNDAQKTMGVITLSLISVDALPSGAGPPVWVVLTAGLAIGLGTYLGGWRIIRTLGRGLTDIRSPQGFAAETASATVILTSAHLGFALSTTQVCSGSIIGAGLGRRRAKVRWNTAGRMAVAWLITLPAAGLIGGGASAVVVHGGTAGTVAVAAAAVAAAAVIYVLSRRSPVTADNVNDAPTVTVNPQPAAAGS